MRRSSCAVAALSFLDATLGAGTAVGQENSGQGSVALFDGSDLDQWVDLGDAYSDHGTLADCGRTMVAT